MPVDSKDTPSTITSKSSIATPVRQKNPPKEICLPVIINLPDTLRPNFNIAPLIQAALDNNLPQMTLLLQNNANPNCMTLNGRTALHIATERADVTMMQLLLRHGANPIATLCTHLLA